MANIGRTFLRFIGALFLAAGATVIDTGPSREFVLASDRIPTVPVVVAATDVPEGTVIDRAALIVAQWPAGTTPAGAYATIDSVANRVARVAIYRGDPIVPGRLASEGTGAGPEIRITPGKRAYGITFDDVGDATRLIAPESRVDVFVVLNDTGGVQVARMILADVRVLAIGSTTAHTFDRLSTPSAIAAIEVTPGEAERVARAAAQGRLRLMLRDNGARQTTTR